VSPALYPVTYPKLEFAPEPIRFALRSRTERTAIVSEEVISCQNTASRPSWQKLAPHVLIHAGEMHSDSRHQTTGRILLRDRDDCAAPSGEDAGVRWRNYSSATT